MTDKHKTNYCNCCDKETMFVNNKCTQCGLHYNDVVPASYREDYDWDFGDEEE